jgi:hypothetical protein
MFSDLSKLIFSLVFKKNVNLKNKIGLKALALSFLLFYSVNSFAVFGFFEKKPQPVVEEKLSADDKIGFVDRTEKDLSLLKSLNIEVKDSIDANSVFKIKSVLQDNDHIYKVVNSDLKNFIVYFNEGQIADADLVFSLITAVGYQAQIKNK